MYEIIVGRNKHTRDIFRNKATIFLGKHYVKMGYERSLANPVLLDVLKPHVMLICGKRGSGKSYTLGVIAEELSSLPEGIKENISCLIFDTLGIFWTMKFANYRESDLMKKWNIKAEKREVFVFVPEKLIPMYEKQGIPVDYGFSIKTAWISAEDWCNLFKIDLNSEKGAILSWAVSQFKSDYEISELTNMIFNNLNFSNENKKQIIARLQTAENWGIFDRSGTDIEKLFPPGKTSIIDLSAFANFSDDKTIKNLVVEIICRTILKKRMNSRKKEEID